MNQEIRKIESITDSERVSGKIDKLDLQSRQIEKERERKKKEKNEIKYSIKFCFVK